MSSEKHEICVTGATGFIASHTIPELLELGYQVRGTVRSLENATAYSHLIKFRRAETNLQFYQAQLLDDNAFDLVVDGVTTVMHMASPYVIDVENPQKDLVDPAVKGTLNVLESCMKSPSVKRVILTSSMAAITDEPNSRQVLTEKNWNEKSSLKRNPYYYSKTMAERAAWKFMEERNPEFDLVVINPFMVIGPSYSKSLNSSNKVFVDLLKGVYPAIMSLTFGMVDVRDVARAHIQAMEISGANGRYICAADAVSMREIVEILSASGYNNYKLPTRGMDNAVGNTLIKLSSYTQSKGIGSYLRSHIGRVPRYSHEKIKSELGMTFRDVRDTILETVEDLRKWGHI